jgi:hypothetical protein
VPVAAGLLEILDWRLQTFEVRKGVDQPGQRLVVLAVERQVGHAIGSVHLVEVLLERLDRPEELEMKGPQEGGRPATEELPQVAKGLDRMAKRALPRVAIAERNEVVVVAPDVEPPLLLDGEDARFSEVEVETTAVPREGFTLVDEGFVARIDEPARLDLDERSRRGIAQTSVARNARAISPGRRGGVWVTIP